MEALRVVAVSLISPLCLFMFGPAILEGWAFVKGDAALHQILRNVAALVLLLFALGALLTRKTGKGAGGRWLPSPDAAPAKRACEVWFLRYGAVWILCFAIIIVTRVYDQWGSRGYFFALGGLMAPLLLQPVLLPAATCDSGKPLLERYSFKANLWMLVFGFIGNYWYTHYFYNVLKASYTMQSWDLNGVPIPMFFATHFYFCFYHTLSNMALRKVRATLRARVHACRHADPALAPSLPCLSDHVAGRHNLHGRVGARLLHRGAGVCHVIHHCLHGGLDDLWVLVLLFRTSPYAMAYACLSASLWLFDE